MWSTNFVGPSACYVVHVLPFAEPKAQYEKPNLMTHFWGKGKARKVVCWFWEISVFHWCQLAIHSHDNAHVLDSGSSYTWMIMPWWVWASVCHETSMTEWWERKRAWSRPLSPHYKPTNLSSLDINENNRAFSEMDALFVNPVIRETCSTISPFLSRIHISSSCKSTSLTQDCKEKLLRLTKLWSHTHTPFLKVYRVTLSWRIVIRAEYVRLSFNLHGQSKPMSFYSCPHNCLHLETLTTEGCLLF